MRTGWYINKRQPRLHKQKGILTEMGILYFQFNNMDLPVQYTHRQVPVKPTMILELQNYNEERQEVVLSVAQKMYLRKVRNGKFDFHGEEYTL